MMLLYRIAGREGGQGMEVQFTPEQAAARIEGLAIFQGSARQGNG